MIINRKRRALGLPQKRIVIINAPDGAPQCDRENLARKIAKEARNVTVIILPHNYKATVSQ